MKKFVLLLVFLGLPLSLAHAARRHWARRPGVVLYQLKSDASGTQRAALTRLLGNRQANASGAHRKVHSHLLSAAAAPGADEEDQAQALLQTGAVSYAEPDYLMPAAAVPNDPSYSLQWHHPMIHAPAAWDVTTGAHSVIVAVCDNGVDASHPDLATNLMLPGFNSADGGSNTSPIADHGTATAGSIGAVGNNGAGGAGIAWKVQMLPVRVTNNSDSSASCSDMASGIEWAADHGAQVINLSYDISGCPNTIDAAAQYAENQGAVVFVAAGNSGINVSAFMPAVHSLVLVGATNSSDSRTTYSNFGTGLDLVAPGNLIYAPIPGNSYTYESGTSLAASISAGVAALLFAMNPAWTPAQIRQMLFTTAHPLTAQDGNGRVDAFAAVSAAYQDMHGGALPPTPSTTPGANQTSGTANLNSVVVFPNPWRADRHSGVPVIFDSLTPDSTVKIFTMSGFLARKLYPTQGRASWDLTNESGDKVASGIYLYSITDGAGHHVQGKVAIIK